MDHRLVRTAIALLAIAASMFRATSVAAETTSAHRTLAASDHTCAITIEGGVVCWGDNSAGGLGDGTTTGSSTPVDVIGLPSGVIAITAGDRYSCALTTGGGVMCWGYNEFGQLGDGTTTNRTTPVDVTGLRGVVAIAARGEHTCALLPDAVKCWGANANGQLGDGTTTNRAAPVDVTSLAGGVAEIAVGGEHTCVLTRESAVKCWGWNATGQLGIGTTTDSSTPLDVTGLEGVVSAIAAGGRHTCALMAAGGIKCWGYNEFGQLGDGTTDRATPVDVVGTPGDATAIVTGGNFSCALLSEGHVSCWGIDLTGQVDDGTPVDVVGLATGTRAIAAGFYHVCVVAGMGGVSCWGGNDTGQLGNGSTTDSLTPVEVKGRGGAPLLAAAAGDGQTTEWVRLVIAGGVGAIVILAGTWYVIARRRH